MVEARGHSGGLAMLWKKRVEGNLLSFGNNHNKMELNLVGYPKFRLTGLNNILYQSDKRGDRRYPSWLISGFQVACSDCNLIDMELTGYPYTWERGKGTNNWVEIRLDRALITQAWRTIFPLATLENHEISASDHCPIWLNLGKQKLRQPAKSFDLRMHRLVSLCASKS